MSATTDQMTTALTNIEAAVTALGSAFAAYEAGRATAKKDRADSSGIARAEDIDNSISTAQLSTVIAGRMAAVGLSPVLGYGLAGVGTQSASWASAWAAKVTAIVP